MSDLLPNLLPDLAPEPEWSGLSPTARERVVRGALRDAIKAVLVSEQMAGWLLSAVQDVLRPLIDVEIRGAYGRLGRNAVDAAVSRVIREAVEREARDLDVTITVRQRRPDAQA